VFVWPKSPQPIASPLRTLRGFHVVQASGSTMEWLAVSDAEPEALTAIVRRLASDDSEP
jgi:hypothetical protein